MPSPSNGSIRAALLLALALAAQGPAPAAAADHEGEVVLAGYGGTIEQFMRNDIIPAFQKKTGIKVTLVVGTAFTNYAKVVAARNRPNIDIYWSNELTHVAGKQQGLYEKLDPAVVTHLPDVLEVARDPDGIGVGSYILATGIVYNSQALKEAGIAAPTSWNDLWDPRLKGKVSLYSFGVAYSQDLVALMTRLAGGSEKDARPGIDKIKTLRQSGNLAQFASSPAELDNSLVQGQSWMSVNGSARAYMLKEQGAPIDFAYPKEGAGYFTNYFDVVKNAPHPKAAQVFVDYLISPEAQLLIAKGTVAAPVNRKVQVPEALKGQIPSPEQIPSMVRIDRAEMNRQLDQWAAMWEREIEAGR